MTDYHTLKFNLKNSWLQSSSLIAAFVLLCILSHSIQADDKSERPKPQESDLLKAVDMAVSSLKKDGVTKETIATQDNLIQILESYFDGGSSSDTQSGRQDGQTKNKPPSPSKSSKPQGSGATSGGAPLENSQAAKTSDKTLRPREKLADSVWGHLPMQERNDLLRSYSESYLPGYEEQVRHYFERLAKLRRRQLKEQPSKPEE